MLGARCATRRLRDAGFVSNSLVIPYLVYAFPCVHFTESVVHGADCALDVVLAYLTLLSATIIPTCGLDAGLQPTKTP